MRNLKSAILFAAATFGVATSAFAGVAGSITVNVVPILNPAVATYSDPGTGFAGTVGYRVDINNAGKNTNNNVRFTAQSYVTDAAEFASYQFDSSEGVTCTATKDAVNVKIDCPIGTLNSGQSAPTFFIFFKSPVFVANGLADAAGTDFANLNHQVFYAEGGNGPKSTPKNGFTTLTAAAPVSLGTRNPELVRSVVLASGGTFFTGNQGIAIFDTDPTKTDNHATKSVVPAQVVHTTAEISETGVACTSPNVVTCYSSQITIPGTFSAAPYLTTTLSQVIQNIKTQVVTVIVPCRRHDHDDCEHSLTTCTKTTTQLVPIEQVVVKYLADVTPANPNPLEQVVAMCAVPTGPPPADGPCISARNVIRDALGNPTRYEWTLISDKNGRLAIN